MQTENSFETRTTVQKYLKRLNELGAEYLKSMEDLVIKDNEYYSIKTQKILLLKNQGESATHINSIIKGMPEVAQAKLSRDLAEAQSKAKQEQINILKLQIREMRGE